MDTPTRRLRFPAGFRFGVATSAYQIEGAVAADGRGPSIWDTFCRTPGKVARGESGDVACDHYARWPEDLQILKSLGVQSYRFSIAWPRILPTGSERVGHPAGLAFYDRLVDALLEAGIEPWVTLNHWDLPQGLQDLGGWPDRRLVDHFVRYTEIVASALGDRVQRWITHNEPWVVAMLGYETGVHAPGERDGARALAAAHHLLLSHGRAVPILRARAPGAQVGITLNLCPAVPASCSPQDAAAAHAFDGYFNRWYLDPLAGKGYPEDRVRACVDQGWLQGADLPFVLPGDLETIAVPTDFLGVNYYSRAVIRASEEGNLPRTLFPLPASAHTDFGWEVHPDSLYDLLMRLHRSYGYQALVVTENGCAYPHGPDADRRVRDPERQVYLRGHLTACHQAVEQGVPLLGYFAWSLLDNFEWAEGYSKRFGLVWVDFDTQERIPKDSFIWYADTIRHGLDPWSFASAAG